ncbi:hypothetical protein Anapl_10127 [Anas platyrhynchos]|uniref:Uncharacterized protein n=1 Tax=Anas platyrhynchos TaxID=8839 RepID=R0LB22_ANAPL|nr:hypothetical protein Anapl_10127 [Anas platyrhynchos]
MLLWSLAKLQKGKGKINTASKQSLCFSEYDICPVFTSGKNNKDTYASNGNRMNDNRETFQSCNGADFILGESNSTTSEEHTRSVAGQSCTHTLTPVLVLEQCNASKEEKVSVWGGPA